MSGVYNPEKNCPECDTPLIECPDCGTEFCDCCGWKEGDEVPE